MEDFWRGSLFSERKLLLLGESAFSWTNEDGDIVHPSPGHARQSIEEVVQSGNAGGGFLQKLTRGLTASENPTPEQVRNAWNRVAFANYVPGTVGVGPRVRPSIDMWANAAQGFLDLLERIGPSSVIVLGKTAWRKMPDAHLWLTDDVQGYKLKNERFAMCWALPHPSAGLGWRRLAQVIAFVTEGKIIEP